MYDNNEIPISRILLSYFLHNPIGNGINWRPNRRLYIYTWMRTAVFSPLESGYPLPPTVPGQMVSTALRLPGRRRVRVGRTDIEGARGELLMGVVCASRAWGL